MKNRSLRKEYLISYDVEDDKIRNCIFKELLQIGLKSVQKSVFWGRLSKAELDSIKRCLQDKLDSKDKAFVIRSDFNKKGQSFSLGHTKEDFIYWKETDVI